ncbi:autotransporter domain-containing protein [Dyella acidisoli]|uniref:Autotransporter domain-containing protein n=1 Tax=Dyella acidisoli TaxID=1867834 RepID=A0ABQ5XV60_9GAMM|nr:autotransporter domain-containing protein [Dyella acidisoli]GLQ95523.1 hypothetical protein GCM10007901_44790 [Dyella acidisoli]
MSKKIDASSIELWRYYRRQPYLFAQLPDAWQLSVEANYAEAMKRLRSRQRRKAIPISILATFAALTVSKAKSAPTTYTTTLTGTSSDTQYSKSTDTSGNLVYSFASGDSISTTGSGANVYSVDLVNSSPKVILQAGTNGAGQLDFTAKRPAVGSWGEVDTINVQSGANLTVNGNSTIYAQADDTLNSDATGVRVYQGTATFNGTTSITTHTPGYSQALWVYQGQVTFNGNASFTAQARGSSTAAIYNSGGGRSSVVINGNATVVGYGIWPSDNVHGIYNDNQNSKLTINGNLLLTATSNGSTVMGIRNQGNLGISGNASITANGPRSAYGIDNTFRTARTYVGGDLTVSVTNTTGYVPFGNPTGLSNLYGMGGFMTFAGAANVNVSATTEDYAINNNGVVSFTNIGKTATLRASTSCSTCNVYGVLNSGGSVTFAGGLDVAETTSGTGHRYAIWNVATTGNNATVTANQAGNQSVNVDGDVLTGSVTDSAGTVYNGTTTLNFDTSTSYLKGLVLGYTQSGIAKLSFTNGASWIPTGTGTLSTDFGSGSLVLGSGSAIDMAASWGAFSRGSVPSYSLRTLQVGSTSSNGASVNLSDGAVFTLLSNIRGGQADKVVFGSGIKSFTAQGKQDVRIAYDPVLDSTSWVNATVIQKGVTIAASSPIVIVDASSAASGTASFLSVAGLTSQWGTTYENALVRFSYVPVVSLSANHKQILLTGIDILGNGTSTTGVGTTASTGSSSTTGSTTSSTTGNTSGTSGTSSTSTSTSSSGTSASSTSSGSTATSTSSVTSTGASSTSSSSTTQAATTTTSSTTTLSGGTVAVTPSTGVLVAGDAALAMSNIWQIDEQAVSRHSESLRLSDASSVSGLWVDTDGSDFNGSSSDGRTYRQNQVNVSVGAERQLAFDGGRDAIGLVYTHTQSHADLQDGKADLRDDSIGVYNTWNSGQGLFADAVVRAGQLRNNYSSSDAFGTTSGHYGSTAASVSVRAGYRFQGARGGYIEPQVQAAYGSIGRSRYTASSDVQFDVNQSHTLLSRAGVLAGKTFFLSPVITGDVYTRVAVVHTAGSRPDITATLDGGSVPVTMPSRRATTGEVAVGGHVALAGRWSVFAEAGHTSRADAVAGGWRASAGVRLSF